MADRVGGREGLHVVGVGLDDVVGFGWGGVQWGGLHHIYCTGGLGGQMLRSEVVQALHHLRSYHLAYELVCIWTTLIVLCCPYPTDPKVGTCLHLRHAFLLCCGTLRWDCVCV